MKPHPFHVGCCPLEPEPGAPTVTLADETAVLEFVRCLPTEAEARAAQGFVTEKAVAIPSGQHGRELLMSRRVRRPPLDADMTAFLAGAVCALRLEAHPADVLLERCRALVAEAYDGRGSDRAREQTALTLLKRVQGDW